MKIVQADRFFLMLIVAVTLVWAAVFSPSLWYVYFPLLGLHGGVFYLTRERPDRIFYLACTGILLAIAVGSVNIWGGMVLAWLLAGMILGSFAAHENVLESRSFFLYMTAVFLIAVMAEFFVNAFIPLVILCLLTAGSIIFLLFRNFRLRREYTGDES